jgi:hypothetical protein
VRRYYPSQLLCAYLLPAVCTAFTSSSHHPTGAGVAAGACSRSFAACARVLKGGAPPPLRETTCRPSSAAMFAVCQTQDTHAKYWPVRLLALASYLSPTHPSTQRRYCQRYGLISSVNVCVCLCVCACVCMCCRVQALRMPGRGASGIDGGLSMLPGTTESSDDENFDATGGQSPAHPLQRTTLLRTAPC